MAGEKNFNVKNGLSVGGVEVVDSSADLVVGAFGTAAKEAIDDQVNTLLTAGSGVSLSYDDTAGTLTITRDAETGDISSVVAGSGLSGGGTSGDVTLTLDTGTVFSEAVADTVGAMVTSNTESGITVAYVDADNTLDFTVGTLNQDTTGSAATLTTTRTINGVGFNGSADITFGTDSVTEGSSNLYHTAERVADTVGAMVTSNTESGIAVTYDDADNTLDFAVATLNQNTTGNAATVTNGVYTTGAQTIAGVKTFSSTIVGDITGDVTGNVTGNTSGSAGTATGNAGSATILATARTLAFTGDVTGTGSFDGSANLSTALTIAANSVALGTDTTGNYVGTITGGTGVTSSAATTGEGTTHSLSIGQDIATSSKPSFAGVTLTANSEITGNFIPSADDTYALGSASKQWSDVYVGPGSLYVNGQQVVSDNSGTITISADINQNVTVQTSGSGDVDLDPTGSGVIGLKGPVQITAGSNVTSTDGNAIAFASAIDVDAIESRSTDTNLTLSANGTGIVTVNDALTVTGDLIVSGTTTTVNSETINLADNIIVLNSNFTSGTPSEDTGFSVLRGGSATKSFVWDESEDKWSVGSETLTATTFEGALTGNVTGNVSGTAGSATGNAATATALATARTIGGTSFDGTANIAVALSATTTALATARTIGGTSFDGTANIAVALSATTTALATARTIGGVSFDGTGNITLPGVNSAGNQSTSGLAATATALATSRTIALSGDVSGSGGFDGTGNLTITTVIADDSHNHTIANVDSLQGTLDAKYSSGSNIAAGTLTTTNASNAGAYVRNVHQSTSAPTSGAGAVGDLWVLYS